MAVHFPREKVREDASAADASGQFLQPLLIKRLARVGAGFAQLRDRYTHVLLQRFDCCFRSHLLFSFSLNSRNFQYSSGKSTVTVRSASVIIQSLSPAFVL